MHVQAKYDIWLTKSIYEKGAHGGVCIYIYVCVCVPVADIWFDPHFGRFSNPGHR